MNALWSQIQDEIRRQLATVGARIYPAGAASAGKIKLRLDPAAATDADELYAMLTPFVPAAGQDAVVITLGGKKFCLGGNGNNAGPRLYSGSGSPEGVVTAAVGSLYLRSDGGSGSIHYGKASGSGNTGWVAVG